MISKMYTQLDPSKSVRKASNGAKGKYIDKAKNKIGILCENHPTWMKFLDETLLVDFMWIGFWKRALQRNSRKHEKLKLFSATDSSEQTAFPKKSSSGLPDPVNFWTHSHFRFERYIILSDFRLEFSKKKILNQILSQPKAVTKGKSLSSIAFWNWKKTCQN